MSDFGTPLFDFTQLEVAPLEITPAPGGTKYIRVKKMQWVVPDNGKKPRLAISLEQREPGQPVKVKTVYFIDWTTAGKPAWPTQPKQEMDRIFSIARTFTGLSDPQIIKHFTGLQLWQQVCQKLIDIMPANLAEMEATWFLRYAKGMDMIEVPADRDIVRLGEHTFKMNPKYDFMTPQGSETVDPAPAAGFNLLDPLAGAFPAFTPATPVAVPGTPPPSLF